MYGARVRGLPNDFRAIRQPLDLADHHVAAGDHEGGARGAVDLHPATTRAGGRFTASLIHRSRREHADSSREYDHEWPQLAGELD